MNKFENTSFWQKTLATQLDPDPDADTRATLRNALENFRERAKILANEIGRSLPNFTVHDITHIDALWEMAQIVAGKDFPITPTEAFVLGGAFLIHDLGMGLAAFPRGLDELRKEQLWQDSVASLLRNKLGRPPKTDEVDNPDPEIEKQATGIVLRELHAKHAEQLALVSWKDSDKTGATEYHLIDDVFLRQTYGPIIGKIAHSHWWPVERLAQDLPLSGVPGGYPADWTVDPIKLACLLRTADASHLDERRAPGFLRALRKPSGVANEHWVFQEKLYQPRLEADRLVYTSKSAFAANEAQAWWLCFDALRVVDNELRQVDALLADMRKPQLAARGVSYVEEPKRLTKLITTSGWEPVDAKIKVGDVAKLVGNLGGEQLYGRNVLVPLRELIQNASDAVRARRLMEHQPDNWGDIYVRHGKDDTGHWIEVEDTGIGMSANVLTGPFLDFGTSFWGTSMMHTELPSLQSKGFSSTGRYGIGFFSVFMWGERVQIVTRRHEKAREDTLILEFQEGLTSRPLLRKALPDELVKEGGTRVRVWLKDPNTFDALLSRHHMEKSWTLEQLCAWLCPAIDVNLYAGGKDKVKKVVTASDWITIKGSDLLKRVLGPSGELKKPEVQTVLTNLAGNLRLLKNSLGNTVGRACIAGDRGVMLSEDENFRSYEFAGIVTVGGFRSSELSSIFGVLVGEPHTASRDIGVPIAEHTVLSQWASDQVTLVSKLHSDAKEISDSAAIIKCCGGDTASLPIALTREGWVSAKDITERTNLPDEIMLLFDASLSNEQRKRGQVTLNENVFVVNPGRPGVLQTGFAPVWVDWPSGELLSANSPIPSDMRTERWLFQSQTLQGAVIQSVANAWNVPFVDVLRASDYSDDNKSIRREVGYRDGKLVEMTVDVLRKPQTKTSLRSKSR